MLIYQVSENDVSIKINSNVKFANLIDIFNTFISVIKFTIKKPKNDYCRTWKRRI